MEKNIIKKKNQEKKAIKKLDLKINHDAFKLARHFDYK